MMTSIVERIAKEQETVWINPNRVSVTPMTEMCGIKYLQVKAAQNRLLRFMPYISSAFPETSDRKGIIESELIHIPIMEKWIKDKGIAYQGQILIKDDAHLPIAGSVKARGGIYEVLCHAETLAMAEGMLNSGDNYSIIDTDEFRSFYNKYTVQVGSTGNLGLSIGIISAKLGFRVIVHMSSDAKEWKKKLLRDKGVTVMEYDGSYSDAVAKGRELSESDQYSYFVDDENSKDLFLGYSTAALRLKVQLFKENITVDDKHPLFVYLPCGVGGAPGGITFGLKQMYGDNVHCFFVEPTKAPCFTLGMATGKHSDISIYDVGLSGDTVADGLAVGRASALVCNMMDGLVSGSVTVKDEDMITFVNTLMETESIRVEPSACAGFAGLMGLYNTGEFKDYISENGLDQYMDNATHIVWATGGGLMPQ